MTDNRYGRKHTDAQTDALKIARDALEGLIDHCVEQERVITEEMHHMDYCGESAPICAARTALEACGLEIKEKNDE